MRSLLELRELSLATPGGRPLFDGLSLRLDREHVALVGRNGVGKSTLLAALAEADDVHVRARSKPYFVPQTLPPGEASHGRRRRRALEAARTSGAEILLLDEPTEDLDEEGVAWLRGWLGSFRGALVVASHDRRILEDFRHFFVASEAGCRLFSGTLGALDADLERERVAQERSYVSRLHRLVSEEERTLHIARRKARKKRHGRSSELDRATPRIRLNQKRDHAQVSHGRLATLREARISDLRAWTKAARRALNVELALDLVSPPLPPPSGAVVVLRDASVRSEGRSLFHLDLEIGRERVGIVGPNGAGKTTLLDVVLGHRAPSTGSAWRDRAKIGSIQQGGVDWVSDESLADHLARHATASSPDRVAATIAAHGFPLALARRPMRSLSPGERTRAALIALFDRTPPVELLVLDEPTYSLDLVGQRAIATALRAWPGGIVVASHDRSFLAAMALEVQILLDPRETTISRVGDGDERRGLRYDSEDGIGA